MSVKQVVIFPDERLREPTREVTVFDDELSKLASDMLDTMYDDEGIGLAGPQVGDNRRIIVIDIPDDQDRQHINPMVLVNPVVTSHSEETVESDEGCLSVPGYQDKVMRYATCTVDYQDLKGNRQRIENATGLLAICLQHETDHLSGKLFIDYLSRLKREMLRRKYSKILKKHH
ncbi:MAG: peptide deformylase [Aeromonadales bacterium]|nr:peptide deformylase [Aeromonadales bacterium]MDY2891746.1 peptide deformylase [Succinivibrio sp.]